MCCTRSETFKTMSLQQNWKVAYFVHLVDNFLYITKNNFYHPSLRTLTTALPIYHGYLMALLMGLMQSLWYAQIWREFCIFCSFADIRLWPCSYSLLTLNIDYVSIIPTWSRQIVIFQILWYHQFIFYVGRSGLDLVWS